MADRKLPISLKVVLSIGYTQEDCMFDKYGKLSLVSLEELENYEYENKDLKENIKEAND